MIQVFLLIALLHGGPQERFAPSHVYVLLSKTRCSSDCYDCHRGKCIQEVPLERYVYHVVQSESGGYYGYSRGYPDQLMEFWKFQAILVRTYAIYQIRVKKRFHKYKYDLNDSPSHQVYNSNVPVRAMIRKATYETRGLVLVSRYNGKIIKSEYYKSCGGTNPRCNRKCSTKTKGGHGRGACQSGSLFYSLDGHIAEWLLHYYFPEAKIVELEFGGT